MKKQKINLKQVIEQKNQDRFAGKSQGWKMTVLEEENEVMAQLLRAVEGHIERIGFEADMIRQILDFEVDFETEEENPF